MAELSNTLASELGVARTKTSSRPKKPSSPEPRPTLKLLSVRFFIGSTKIANTLSLGKYQGSKDASASESLYVKNYTY